MSSTCKDEFKECNAKICDPTGDKFMVNLKFGMYVNWGRPNHNPSRLEPIVKILKSKGYGIQLEHEEDKYDYVELIRESDKVVLIRNDNFQHNRNFESRDSVAATMVQEMEDKLAIMI